MSNIKIKVLFIGADFKAPNQIWGGTVATCHAFREAFKGHEKYEIIFKSRNNLMSAKDVQGVIDSTPHDILHVDDARLMGIIFNGGLPVPDVIGPITRSPIKPYKNWTCPYTKEYFYEAEVIRLNRSEEYLYKGRVDYTDKINFINHGIDTELLKPSTKEKNIVLWAGDGNRPAKNFELWQEIIKKVKLPAGYKFMTMSKYSVQDYWKKLDNVKIIVNTSRYETFCSAMFEAKSKAIPSIYKENLHNGRHSDSRIQVEYTVEGYEKEILKLLTDPAYYKKEAQASHEYTVNNFSLKRMAETYSDVYDKVLIKKGV